MLLEKINEDLKTAMKAKSVLDLSVLRMLISAIKNKKIELKKQDDLNDDEIVAVLKSEVKKRKDSITSYIEGDRDDLAQIEESEIKIIQKYLPEEMSEDAVREVVSAVIADAGEVTMQDFGRIMGATMAKLKNQADGAVVQKIVKELLS